MNTQTNWILNCPAPNCGQLANAYYNAGPMLANDRNSTTEEDSKMQLVFNVTDADFNEYIQNLKNLGIEGYLERDLGADKFFAFHYADKHYHVSYLATRGEIRVIEDAAYVSCRNFGYETNGTEQTILYQYGLYYDPDNNVTDKTVNCGMLYIIKLSDNSLFMMDAGHIRQWNEEAMQALWQFLHKITNTPEDGTIHIAGWYFTHVHDDHTDGCTKLLHHYHEHIQLERILFNFPSRRYVGGYSETVYDMKKTVSEWYPNAKLLKLHTGQIFNLADMTIEVFYTHEDAASKENLNHFPFGDSNCTSSILKATINDKSVMLLGDTNIETEALLAKYSDKTLWKADMVQLAHHCFNFLDTLYEWIAAPVVIVPNSYGGAHQPENVAKLAGAEKYMKENQIYYEGSGTYGLIATPAGWKQVEFYPLIGGEYDFSGF